MLALSAFTDAMQQAGQRRLLLLSGSQDWCQQQTADWQQQLPGDWLTLSTQDSARHLLGQEFTHAIYTAQQGINAEALAALSGTLRAGSWLIVQVPAWDQWANTPDGDSLRWHEQDVPIPTPAFIHHLQSCLQQDADVVIWREGQACELPAPPPALAWQKDASQQQQALLTQLRAAPPGNYVLTAARGRGKSALAGQLAACWPGRCLVTAPAKVSTQVLAQFAGEAFSFMAPDALLAACEQQRVPQADWLLIDEAAAIPLPQLQQLVGYFSRVLFTTTVQGYEGTGRGFVLKFCATLANVTLMTLDCPQRWGVQCPLERVMGRIMVFAEPEPLPVTQITHSATLTAQTPAQLLALYQLLTSAHYRTSPLDLRRLLDAPGQRFRAVFAGELVVAGVWLVEEGGLDERLAQQVWAGYRRPKGNLVAQSLAAHGGWPQAATLRSQRVSRIAVTPALRRHGIGQQLIEQVQAEAEADIDFLSVSFGYTRALWDFWHACGFQLVRLGTQREASSGCYSAMAIKPLTEAAHALAQRMSQSLQQRLGADGHALALAEWPCTPQCSLRFEVEDWRSLAGFAWAQRPLESVIAPTQALLSRSTLALPLLRGTLREGLSAAVLCHQHRLQGRRELLQALRQEARLALQHWDAEQAQYWQQHVQSLQ